MGYVQLFINLLLGEPLFITFMGYVQLFISLLLGEPLLNFLFEDGLKRGTNVMSEGPKISPN
jgi:hypothetical protein